MQLNESYAKLDAAIDQACKKYEKISVDCGAPAELMYRDEQDKECK